MRVLPQKRERASEQEFKMLFISLFSSSNCSDMASGRWRESCICMFFICRQCSQSVQGFGCLVLRSIGAWMLECPGSK